MHGSGWMVGELGYKLWVALSVGRMIKQTAGQLAVCKVLDGEALDTTCGSLCVLGGREMTQAGSCMQDDGWRIGEGLG